MTATRPRTAPTPAVEPSGTLGERLAALYVPQAARLSRSVATLAECGPGTDTTAARRDLEVLDGFTALRHLLDERRLLDLDPDTGTDARGRTDLLGVLNVAFGALVLSPRHRDAVEGLRAQVGRLIERDRREGPVPA